MNNTHNRIAEMIREEKEQDPVAWMYDFPDPDNPMEEVVHNWTAYSLAEVELNCGFNIRPLYTAPPQRKWVGLTYKERCELWNISSKFSPEAVIMQDFAKDIESRLRELNT